MAKFSVFIAKVIFPTDLVIAKNFIFHLATLVSKFSTLPMEKSESRFAGIRFYMINAIGIKESEYLYL